MRHARIDGDLDLPMTHLHFGQALPDRYRRQMVPSGERQLTSL
jgi:hypothetical protein